MVDMTQAEFEQAYAVRSGVTVGWLHKQGRAAFPCRCDDEGCEGWQMVNAAEWFDNLKAELGVSWVEGNCVVSFNGWEICTFYQVSEITFDLSAWLVAALWNERHETSRN